MTVKAILPLGLTFVVLGIGLGFGQEVLGDQAEDICLDDGGYYNNTQRACWTNSAQENGTQGGDFNATVDGSTGLNNFSGKMPLVALVVVTAVIIGIITTFLVIRK